MKQLVTDPSFTNANFWALSGVGVSIADGKLKYTASATSPSVMPVPNVVAEVGKTYHWFLIVTRLQFCISLSANFGGVAFWNNAGKAPGVYSGTLVAATTGGLQFVALGSNADIDLVAINKGNGIVIDHDVIRKGIRALISAVPGIPSAIAWENRDFTPVVGVPWIRETLLPGEQTKVAFDVLQETGLMQFDLFYPVSKGTEAAEGLVDLIIDQFKPDTGISASARTLRASRASGRREDDWYIVPVRITYLAHSFG